MTSHLSRRALLGSAALAGFGGLLAACGSSGSSSSGTSSGDVGEAQGLTDIEPLEGIEKTELTIGFIPITCSAPLIMADPLGFYERHGLDVTLRKYGGWADIRDAFVAGEIDASHLLSPMPFSITHGLGSAALPTRLAAVQNINGQAITLANRHADTVGGPEDLAGMTLTVPFDFSMHNFLLRAFLAEAGLDPDRDVDIQVMRPPDMVQALVSGDIDGYLGPDPFNQRAVHEDAGFIYELSRDMWEGHPCCGFGVQESFIQENPVTYQALLRAVNDASLWSSEPENRGQAAEAIAPEQYLNQPPEVVGAVLTGEFEDGRGGELAVPDRIDFDPYPWGSFGMWMATQMVRWDLAEADLFSGPDELRTMALEVFDTASCREAIEAVGGEAPSEEVRVEQILGREFDPADPMGWTERFLS
jgi:nitrate/nitrite transport system substrate-binding protein